MTQAFNLSQLANNLNSSGQLDATDGLVNAVPVGNGGTGASSASAARTNLGLTIGTNVPSPTGTGASGTWNISISGNAATATSATSATSATTATSAGSASTAAACSGNSATATKLTTASGSAPSFGARAYVNFDGLGAIGSSMTLRSSGNIASVVRETTSTYIVTFTTAMPTSSYCVATSGEGYTLGSAGALQGPSTFSLTSTSFYIAVASNTNSASSGWPTVSAVIFC